MGQILLTTFQQAIAAAGRTQAIISAPSNRRVLIHGIYRDLADTTAVGTTAQPLIAPKGESPSAPLNWTNAAGAGPFYDPANPGGRYRWGLILPPNTSLVLDMGNVGGGGNLVVAVEYEVLPQEV